MSFSLFTTRVEDLLEDVSYALIEKIVSTTVATSITIRGFNTVFPFSMSGIYVGAYLIADVDGMQEQVTVTAVTTTSFTAYFANLHTGPFQIVGATFPSSASENPLFTQDEVMAYLAEVQNDFLLKTRIIFGVTGTPGEPPNIPLVDQTRIYQQPDPAIRIERLARIIPNEPQPIMDLYDTTQADLDMDNFAWSADSDIPKNWFQDQTDTAQFGLDPMPNVNGFMELWYSKRGPIGNKGRLFLTSKLLIPDVMIHYIKYGILARCWSKDGETRDPLRADYCRKRFEFGITVVQRFMEGISLNTGAAKQTYSPMAVPQG